MWYREGSGLLAEVVDPRSLLSLHNGAVRHLEHLRSHRPVCREGEEEENDGWIGIQVFGWTDSTIALFTLWGCLDYAIWFLPSALLLSQSLRYSVVTFPRKPKYIPNFESSQGRSIFLHAGWCLSSMSASSYSFDGIIFHSPLSCRFGSLIMRFIAWYISARSHTAGGGFRDNVSPHQALS